MQQSTAIIVFKTSSACSALRPRERGDQAWQTRQECGLKEQARVIKPEESSVMSGISGEYALPAAMFLSHPGRSMPEREHTPPAARAGIVWPQRHIPPPGQALFTRQSCRHFKKWLLAPFRLH